MIDSIAKTIVLICCHAGPADHFATFAEALTNSGQDVEVYASGPAVKKFQDKNIAIKTTFSADGLSLEEEEALASQIAKTCQKASIVLTDVGHAFNISLQKALSIEAPNVLRAAYYDNPESYVPGGYSATAQKVMEASQRVLFANANLAQDPTIDISIKDRIGIGYYPVSQANKISKKRSEEKIQKRSLFLESENIKDQGQKVLVYFGGNNEEYFAKAFPAFLSFLSEAIEQQDLSSFIIVLQQHPGAKTKNLDRRLFESWLTEHQKNARSPKIIVSSKTTDEMLVLADGALYHQTSMGPLFAIAGIPTIQIGKDPYEDILIKQSLCPSVTSSSKLREAFSSIQPVIFSDERTQIIFQSLGIKSEWAKELEKALKCD